MRSPLKSPVKGSPPAAITASSAAQEPMSDSDTDLSGDDDSDVSMLVMLTSLNLAGL